MLLSVSRLSKYLLPPHPAQAMGRIKASEVKSSIEAIWNHPYPACPILEPDLVGLTYGQVAIVKQVQMAAGGDPGAFDRILDRMIGRPLQVNHNVNANKSYKDFCIEVAKEEGILDADVVPPGPGGESSQQTLQ